VVFWVCLLLQCSSPDSITTSYGIYGHSRSSTATTYSLHTHTTYSIHTHTTHTTTYCTHATTITCSTHTHITTSSTHTVALGWSCNAGGHQGAQGAHKARHVLCVLAPVHIYVCRYVCVSECWLLSVCGGVCRYVCVCVCV